MIPALAQPVVAMMLLSLLVWIYMYLLRLRYIFGNKVDAQSIATPEMLNAVLPAAVNLPSNNLKNLFELPVIFYAVCAFSSLLQSVDAVLVKLAWTYVGLRALHSLIQCSVNIVLARFTVYVLSSLALWIMVVRLAMAAFH